MKGIKNVARKTKRIITGDRSTWVPLYYSLSSDTVAVRPGQGFYKMTDLIRENSEEDIIKTVYRFLSI